MAISGQTDNRVQTNLSPRVTLLCMMYLVSDQNDHEPSTIVFTVYYNSHKLNVPCPVIGLLIGPMKRLNTYKNFKYRFQQSEFLLQKRTQSGGIKRRYSKLLLAQLPRLIRLEF